MSFFKDHLLGITIFAIATGVASSVLWDVAKQKRPKIVDEIAAFIWPEPAQASSAAPASTATTAPPATRVRPPQGSRPERIVQLSGARDIWTTSVYSFAPGGGGPGGGLENEELIVGGWGDSYHALIQFDINGLPADIEHVSLQLYCFKSHGGGTTPMAVDRVAESWDWNSSGSGKDRERLWWADRPKTVEWKERVAPCAVGNWYTIDISDLYRQWTAGTLPNYGIQLRPLNNDNRWNEFYSSRFAGNSSLRPRLVVR